MSFLAVEAQALFDTFGQIHVLPACARIVRRIHEHWAKGAAPEREKVSICMLLGFNSQLSQIEYALEHQLLYEAFSTLCRYPEQITSHYYAAKGDIDGTQHVLDPDMTEQGYGQEPIKCLFISLQLSERAARYSHLIARRGAAESASIPGGARCTGKRSIFTFRICQHCSTCALGGCYSYHKLSPATRRTLRRLVETTRISSALTMRTQYDQKQA